MDMSHWKLTDRGLFRSLLFENFTQLTAFLAALGPVADALDHHPDLTVRKARYLDVYLITHDQQQVTDLDYDLAKKMDELFESY